MAWTAQKTWAFQEGVESAELNLYLRDDVEYLLSHAKMKPADEIVISSSTLQDDNDLFFPVLANEMWSVQLYLSISSGTGPDFKFNFSVPAATTYAFSQISQATAVCLDYVNSDQSISTSGAGNNAAIIPAFFRVGATPGTVTFRWAQNTPTATNTILQAGSSLIARRCS
jgi:hypothetical protein